MTKRYGEAYVHSPEKRRLDIFVATGLLPLELGVRALAFGQTAPGISPILRQERAGAKGKPFEVLKLRTLQDDGVTPLSPLMDTFRQNGLDELPQVRNILRGDMSLVGRRPLLLAEYQEQYDIVGADREGARLVDYHRRTAGAAKPGLLSTHAIQGHRGDVSVMNLASRLELDIRDFEQASHAHTIHLVRRVFSSMSHGELKHGSIRLVAAGTEDPATPQAS